MTTEQHGIGYDRLLFGDQTEFVDRRVFALQAVTAVHTHSWGMDKADFAVELNQATITFEGEWNIATAPVQVVGTYNAKYGTCLWGWDHPPVSLRCAETAGAMGQFADDQGLTALQTRKIEFSEANAWVFAALVAHVTAYKARTAGLPA